MCFTTLLLVSLADSKNSSYRYMVQFPSIPYFLSLSWFHHSPTSHPNDAYSYLIDILKISRTSFSNNLYSSSLFRSSFSIQTSSAMRLPELNAIINPRTLTTKSFSHSPILSHLNSTLTLHSCERRTNHELACTVTTQHMSLALDSAHRRRRYLLR
jgi:hypothetical protein